ncbi:MULTISPECIES: exonuclease domain-containing protein [Actinosynnema]|uniref:exonuclease domain-containing protein n=1 Tax=Actinosynnema TaxID=40566 RepID=UPI0020A3770B|nr:exonuclease domain-containing protein [Actinosynnema pretiosum]MCP2093556.1 DNA polymerase-3 subunit epsilon [Actinosynnema pretiosum]
MGYAVVDVETTGFRRSDRVVEVAVVQLDRDRRVTGEWCTLLNPGRDLGPQHVHRIRAADVWGAPTFARAAGALARRLAGRVLVAHNLAFDARFLAAEFGRVGVDADFDGLCTMRLSGGRRSLRDCCAGAGVPLVDAHSALADAHAAAALFARLPEAPPAGALDLPPLGEDVPEVRRGAADLAPSSAPASGGEGPSARLARGDLVVFTGQMDDARDVWVDRALGAGLRVNSGYVTRATALLVAADPFSLSTKARRARAYRVPIVSEGAFAALLAGLATTRTGGLPDGLVDEPLGKIS